MRKRSIPYLSFLFIILTTVSAFGSGDPIRYTVRVDAADLSGFDVELHVPNALRAAMAAHPEYDDRYFRYVENFSARSDGRNLAFTKPEEAVWQIDNIRGGLTVRYRVAPPPKERQWRQTWKPFLTPTGGRVGDLHMLMYVVGMEKSPARLTLDMPAGWKAVSGLERTNDARTFVGSVEEMLDSPVLIGDLREWRFTAGGVPHVVAIWSPPDARPADAEAIVNGIQRLTDQAIRAFGKPPYPRYAFLLENGGQAALEHRSSLNAAISPELVDVFRRIGHEYVHVWNLMDVRPRERVGIRYKFAEPTGVLWWSEGATIFFADLLARRAGLPVEQRTRTERLGSLLTRFLAAPGYSTLSAELVSRGDSHPDLLTDDWASTHLQGEVLVSLLDLKIRDATNGRRRLDDVIRLLSARHNIDGGIDNSHIEQALAEVCRCEMAGFFREHIYAANHIDLDRYLDLAGLRAEIGRVPAVDGEGRPLVDLRIGPVSPEGERKLRINNSNSAWGRSGLRSGDKVISANGEPVADWNAFRAWLRTLKVDDSVRLVIERDGAARTVEVRLAAFDLPSVRILESENASAKQVRLRNAWVIGN